MQPLEGLEDLVGKLHVEPNTVIFDEEDPLPLSLKRSNPDVAALRRVLHRVLDQVLRRDPHQSPIAVPSQAGLRIVRI